MPLSLIAPLLPRLDLRSELLVALLNQLHIEDTAEGLLFAVPLLKEEVHCSQVQLQVSKLKFVLRKELAVFGGRLLLSLGVFLGVKRICRVWIGV